MAEVKPMMVKVEALKYHTTDGREYQVGDKYDVPESAIENLAAQGMAVRVDRAAVARKARSAAKSKAKASRSVVSKVRKAAKIKVGKHKS